MIKISKSVIITTILILFLFVLYQDVFAGYIDPQQQIAIDQPVGHEVVKFEIWKWVSGVSTVIIGVGLTYYLNNRKKGRDENFRNSKV